MCDLNYNIKIRKATADEDWKKPFKTIHESFLRIIN